MFQKTSTLLALAYCLSSTIPAHGQAAQTVSTRAASKDNRIYVAFRMRNWKAKHIHDASQAKTHADTLRQLGCEVKVAQHNGHTDVQCRTSVWKSMVLDLPDQADQWQKWLQDAGFETLHGHLAPTGMPATSSGGNQPHREIVNYRLTNWKTQHIHKEQEAGQLLTLYRALGCQTQSAQHAGHIDIKIHCPQWMELELPSHATAHRWQTFLNKAGFETQHSH